MEPWGISLPENFIHSNSKCLTVINTKKKSIQQELYLNLLAIESKPNHIFEK